MPRGCPLALLLAAGLALGCSRPDDDGSATTRAAGVVDTAGVAADGAAPIAPEPGEEPYLANIRQLTFEGQNAEAYFSPDDDRLIFQSTSGSLGCDQIFTMRADGSDRRMVSTGAGVTTCAYFVYPDASGIVYSSDPPRRFHLPGARRLQSRVPCGPFILDTTCSARTSTAGTSCA